YWLPQVLLGKTITGWFSFEKETLLDYKVEVRKDSCTKSQK
ncbi:MAG: hypothetical protein ACI9CE_003972, partial [Flavobacterium sp.]